MKFQFYFRVVLPTDSPTNLKMIPPADFQSYLSVILYADFAV